MRSDTRRYPATTAITTTAPADPLRLRTDIDAENWVAWNELEFVGQASAIGAARLDELRRGRAMKKRKMDDLWGNR